MNLDQKQLFDALRQGESDTAEFVVEKDHIEPGRTFSADAMAFVTEQLTIFVGARIMAAWDRRSEPPSRCSIIVTVEAS